jgi:hypothetical protein
MLRSCDDGTTLTPNDTHSASPARLT